MRYLRNRLRSGISRKYDVLRLDRHTLLCRVRLLDNTELDVYLAVGGALFYLILLKFVNEHMFFW